MATTKKQITDKAKIYWIVYFLCALRCTAGEIDKKKPQEKKLEWRQDNSFRVRRRPSRLRMDSADAMEKRNKKVVVVVVQTNNNMCCIFSPSSDSVLCRLLLSIVFYCILWCRVHATVFAHLSTTLNDATAVHRPSILLFLLSFGYFSRRYRWLGLFACRRTYLLMILHSHWSQVNRR